MAEPMVSARPTPQTGRPAPRPAPPTPSAESTPTARPYPTARPTSAAREPGLVSFTDDAKLFTVSYPPGWELVRSVMVDVDEIAGRATESASSGVGRPTIRVVFFAGVPALQRYPSSVSIVIESLPAGVALSEYFEATQGIARGLFAGYELHSQASVLVGGRQAIMTDVEYDIPSSAPGTNKWRIIQTVTVDGTTGWAISCGFAARQSAEDLKTCDSVVRSFELLK